MWCQHLHSTIPDALCAFLYYQQYTKDVDELMLIMLLLIIVCFIYMSSWWHNMSGISSYLMWICLCLFPFVSSLIFMKHYACVWWNSMKIKKKQKKNTNRKIVLITSPLLSQGSKYSQTKWMLLMTYEWF